MKHLPSRVCANGRCDSFCQRALRARGAPTALSRNSERRMVGRCRTGGGIQPRKCMKTNSKKARAAPTKALRVIKKKTPAGRSGTSLARTDRLLHELQVHQVELEA